MRTERRRFDRLPLRIPLFLRGVDKNGKEFLDFTLAVNLSAGGALIVSRRSLACGSRLFLEIPTPPLPHFPVTRATKRTLSARVLRGINKHTFSLYAVHFARPLIGKRRRAKPLNARAGSSHGMLTDVNPKAAAPPETAVIPKDPQFIRGLAA